MDMQAAMKTHLSQSAGIGAFGGQHGIALAISSIMSADISDDAICDGVISSAITCIGACEDVSAITGRATGANASPATIKATSRRRMVKPRFTRQSSHKWAAMESS